jgi:hypothetical protein
MLSLNTHRVKRTTYTASSVTITPVTITMRLIFTSIREYKKRQSIIPPMMEEMNQMSSLISLFFLFIINTSYKGGGAYK